VKLDDLMGDSHAHRIIGAIHHAEPLQRAPLHQIEQLLFLRPHLAVREKTPDGHVVL